MRMNLGSSAGAVLLLVAGATAAQTADRSAAPPSAAMAVPPARTGTYMVSDGELIVAPGLRIPNGNVPWVLDTISGRQVLIPIHHAMLVSTPLPVQQQGMAQSSVSSQPVSSGATLEGAASHTAIHSSEPIFFVHTSDRTENTGDSGRGTPTGWALLAPSVEGTTRTVPHIRFSEVSGGTVCAPPVLCTEAESLPGGWLRIVPREPLPQGEYVLLPVPRTATASSPLAYDFTIDAQSKVPRDTVSPRQNMDLPITRKKR